MQCDRAGLLSEQDGERADGDGGRGGESGAGDAESARRASRGYCGAGGVFEQ